MKRVLGIALMLSLVGTLSLLAQDVKPGKTGLIDLGNDVKLEMLLIPAGKFKMGEPGKDHEVTLTKPFYMGKYEVTQDQWEAVMGENPSTKKGVKLPVTDVSWNDCQKFIKKLNEKTNGGYRLPTEAEWEYACRAGTTTAYSFGDKMTPKDANYKVSKLDNSEVVAVGSYKANGFGLYDMHGNVWEWCEDWKDDYPEGAVTDPKGPGTGTSRVLRGGSFNFVESWACSSMRFFLPLSPDTRNFFFGFRLARATDTKSKEAKAKEAQKEVAKSLQKEVEEKADLGKGVKLEMVLIPAGKFKMGSPPLVFGFRLQHEVMLTKPFYMGKYEVTQEQWESVMGDNPCSTKGAKLPVTNVSWNDCQEFIKKLNKKTDGGYRLPSESEWEYGCRAGTTTAYSFGDKITPQDANYKDSKIGKLVAVGSYNPNAFGLYDMHGNVWEWCEDWMADYPEADVTDPKGPTTGKGRVVRGGLFSHREEEVRSASRNYGPPTLRFDDGIGFRLVRIPDSKASIALPTETKPDPAGVIPAGNLLVAPFTEVKAKEVQKEVAKSLQKEVEEKADLGKSVNLEMILIPAAKFKMGDTQKELEESEEKLKEEFKKIVGKDFGKRALELIDLMIGIQGRQHEVTLTKPFYMSKYEVTQEQWESVMGSNPSDTKGAKLPVMNVSWEDCQEFIKKLNASTKGGYRLPYEAEWEYACRAGTTTAHSFGDEITTKDANYRESEIVKPVAVGSYQPNAFGLYDMHGNVGEWCEDWRADYPTGAVTDPKGPATGKGRVLRGGSFDDSVSLTRSSFRLTNTPTKRNKNYGFRLVRIPDSKASIASPTETKPDSAGVIPAGNQLVAPFTEVKAKEVQKEVAKILKKEVKEKADLGKDVKLEMVLIPAGKFMMGSPITEVDRKDDETQHEVTLTKPYFMGKYEVTQEQWEAVMGKNPSSRNKGAKLPVTDVSWEDCQEFIKKLNKKTSGGFRLPIEAEWEFACRAGTTTAYSFGDKITPQDANFKASNIGKPVAVGSYQPNAFGLYDMHGNVWEWCEDWFGAYPAGSVTDPKGAATEIIRVFRSGSFSSNGSRARSSGRFWDTPTGRDFNVGFRLARTP